MPLSALEILQEWGVRLDKGRVSSRPQEVELPPFMTRQLSQQTDPLALYSATLSVAVVTELWSDARRGDVRLASASTWVPATVSGHRVHPALDNIDPWNEGVRSQVMYLNLWHDDVRRFAGFDVVGLRERGEQGQDATPRLLHVQKLKRSTNQILINLEGCGALPLGHSLEIAPFANIRTRDAELQAVQQLRHSDPVRSVLRPEFPIARVPTAAHVTRLQDPSAHPRSVPEVYNLTAGPGPHHRRQVGDPLPYPSPKAVISGHEVHSLDDPQANVVQAVESLAEGVVLVQAPPGTQDWQVTVSVLKRLKEVKPFAKVLVCAQSNSAVDALCGRAMEADLSHLIVRTGDQGRFNASVQSVSLGSLSLGRVNAMTASSRSTTPEDIETKIGKELAMFSAGKKEEAEFKLAVGRLREELRAARRRRQKEDQSRAEVLEGVSFVFSTLGSADAGHFHDWKFDLVIIHGAHAACEARTLLALRHAPRALLFGDQRQLQPIVSDANRWSGYNRSLFERLVDNSYPVMLLNRQVEFHPSIYRQVAEQVYKGKVTNGAGAGGGTGGPVLALPSWQKASPVWHPNTVVHVVEGCEQAAGTSVTNPAEVRAVVDVFQAVLRKISGDPVAVRNGGIRVGVVTPYGAQDKALEAALRSVSVPDHISLKCGTVTAAQEDLFDVVIVSCVRTKFPGILSDQRTANVAVTRGTQLRVIVGDLSLLEHVGLWGSILACPTVAKMEWRESESPSGRFKYTRVS